METKIEEDLESIESEGKVWWKVATNPTFIPDSERIHTSVDGRFITIFRNKSILSALDSTCYHAGGPLGNGKIMDIEELGISTVLCPWHKFSVSLVDGTRAYQAVNMVNGKPTTGNWTLGKVVQRTHFVKEDNDGIYVVSCYYYRKNLYLHKS